MGNVFSCRWQIAERRILLVQEFVVEFLLNNLAGALLDLADVDEHSSCWINRRGKNKIDDVVATRAVARSALGSEREQVLSIRPVSNEQPARGREFETFADRQ